VIFGAPSWSGDQFSGNWDVIRYYGLDHLRITFLALGLGILVAFPLGLISYRWRRAYPPILSISNTLYAIPSLALLMLLGSLFGQILTDKSLIITLAIYTIAILVRNIVDGLRAVPDAVKDAALAVGYTPRRRLLAIELPLALPAIIAGLRVATVSTISLVSVGGAIGLGGLGFVFYHGYSRGLKSEIWAGLLASIALAVVMDVLIVLAGRALTPWARRRAAS
jgi:osmoprotectant transport system permease protein